MFAFEQCQSTCPSYSFSAGECEQICLCLFHKYLRRLINARFSCCCNLILSRCMCWQLNFDIPLEQQGSFDVILHKLTDQMCHSPDGNQLTVKHMDAVQVLCRCVHSDCCEILVYMILSTDNSWVNNVILAVNKWLPSNSSYAGSWFIRLYSLVYLYFTFFTQNCVLTTSHE